MLRARMIPAGSNHWNISCPLSRFGYHEDPGDSHPSMSISVDERGASLFYCFACGQKGVLRTLAFNLQRLSHGQYGAVADFVETHDGVAPSRKRLDEVDEAAHQPASYLPETALGRYRRAVPQYLLNRGVSLDVVRLFDLRYDERNAKIIFPVRDFSGGICGLVMRTLKNTGQRYAYSPGFAKSCYLYGVHEQRANLESAPTIILAEGPMDVLVSLSRGIGPICAVMGSTVSRAQRDLIKLHFSNKRVIILGDGDAAGRRLVSEAQESLAQHVDLWTANVPNGEDPASLTTEGMKAVLERLIPLR